MWLALKHAAASKKTRGRGGQSGAVSVSPTTTADLDEYKRLKEEFPDVEAPSADMYGLPDEVAHLKLLRDLKQQQQLDAAPKAKRLPERDPGWYTDPQSQSAGYGMPPMDRRTPGDMMGAPEYRQKPQSMNDWYKFLGDKGIFLDGDGRRLQPRRRRPIDNHDIWSDLIDGPYPTSGALVDLPEDEGGLGKSWKQKAKELFSGRKSSAEVTEYVNEALSESGL